jgi:hypothetical protein
MGIWPLAFNGMASVGSLGIADAVRISVGYLPTKFVPQMTISIPAEMRGGSTMGFDVEKKPHRQ